MKADRSTGLDFPLIVAALAIVCIFPLHPSLAAVPSSYEKCGIKKVDDLRYRAVTIVDVVSKRLRDINPNTRKSTGNRIQRDEVVPNGETVRDAYGLICLQKKGGGYFWTYSSVVKYKCKPVKNGDRSEGGMGIGMGACVDDEW